MLTPPASRLPVFSARALSLAAAAASDRPRRQRRPLLLGLVLFANEPARLLAYAQEVLFAYAARGIDVFLQTDVSEAHSVPRAITLEDIDEIIANSPVEHTILLTDHDIARQTVQVRVGVRFVERNIDKHAIIVLESWASEIAREQTQDAKISLAMNPNIVTSKHIDFLLQQHPLLRGIRPAYASLARLVDCTQKWLADHNEHHPFGTPSDPSPPVDAPPQEQSSDVVSGPSSSASPSTGDQAPSAPSDANSETSHTVSKERMDELSRAALSQGISEIIARNNGDASETEDDVLNRSTLSMRWLNRSQQMSARLLRGQFLVQSLHSKLLAAFPIISAAPIVSGSESAPKDVYSVPSEAHRQRLLREVNFLIARIEELGSRLSRRPKTRRRRRMSSPVNPWTSYINRYRSSASHPVGISALAPHVTFKNGREIEHSGSWRCTGCHSINERSHTSCRCCKAASCVLEPGLLPETSENMSIRIRAAIKAASRQRRPWIFAPTPLPPPAAGTGPTSMLSGVGRRADNMTFGMGRAPAPNAEPRRVPLQQRSHDSFLPPGHRLSPDLLDAFKAISVDDVAQNGLGAQGRLFEPHSLDAVRGPLGNLQDFPLPNGHGMSNVNAIPIARSPNRFDTSPPIRSPEGLDYRSLPRRMPGEDQRAASLDANLLGSSLGRLSSNQWYSEKQASREIPLHGRAPHHGGTSDFMLGSSPPLFGGLNGVFAGNGYMADSMHPVKSSGRGIADIPLGLNGRAMMGQQPRSYEHFSNAAQVSTANGARPIHIGQTASHMEELAVGSIEAPDLPSRYMNAVGRRVFPNSAVHSGLEQRSSLEELAAASDAANGGLGSATMESMRAVLALRTTEFESNGDGQRGDHGGGYGLF